MGSLLIRRVRADQRSIACPGIPYRDLIPLFILHMYSPGGVTSLPYKDWIKGIKLGDLDAAD